MSSDTDSDTFIAACVLVLIICFLLGGCEKHDEEISIFEPCLEQENLTTGVWYLVTVMKPDNGTPICTVNEFESGFEFDNTSMQWHIMGSENIGSRDPEFMWG